MTNILFIKSFLVCTLTQEDLQTPGVALGVVLLVGDFISGGYISNNGSIICSTDSGVPSSFTSDGKTFISCYSSSLMVDMLCHYTKYVSVSDQADISSISVSGSTNSMCGTSVSALSTPVILSFPIICFLQSSNFRSLG